MRVKKHLGGMRIKASTLDAESRSLTAVISSDSVDRDGEVVLPKAFKSRLSDDGYPLLWMHDPTKPPIGRVTDVQIDSKSIEARINFRKDNGLADEVFSCFEGGYLNSFSIGFQVHDYDMRDMTVEGKTKKVPHVTDAELLEVSAVNIPSNRDALTRAAKFAGIEPEAIVQWKALEMTDDEILRKALRIAEEAKQMRLDEVIVPKTIDELLEQLRLAVLQPTGVQADGGDEGAAEQLEALRALSWREGE